MRGSFPPGFYRAGGPRTGGVRGPFLGPAAEGLEEGDGRPPMRLFLAMLPHETNTFSNVPTDRGQFEARDLRYGGEIVEAYRGTGTCLRGMIQDGERPAQAHLPSML